MARIILPADFTGSKTLTENIAAKHVKDGAKSPLIQYMLQQDFNIADDVEALNTAQTNHSTGRLLARQAENYSELRDNSFAAPFKNMENGVQFLKKLYRGNERNLGDWGITINNNNKVVYPGSFDARVKVFQEYATKHATYTPPPSPLQPFIDENKIDMATDATKATQAVAYQTNFLKAVKEAEEQISLRDLLWLPTIEHNRGIGQFLMRLYSANPKKAGEWGFVVDDSPRAPKLQKSTVMPADKKSVQSIVIGSAFTNTGTTTLHVYNGKSTSGTPNIVAPGEVLGMIKGFSIITVVNPSTLVTGKFTTLQNI